MSMSPAPFRRHREAVRFVGSSRIAPLRGCGETGYAVTLFALTMLAIVASASAKTLTVASDGSGDFASVQAAVDAAPANSAERVVIHIKPGTYKERVHVRKDKPRLTFRGDDAKTT